MEFVCKTYVKEFNKKKGEMFYRHLPDNVFVKDKGIRVDRQVKYNGKIQTVTFFVSQDGEWYNATEAMAGLKINGRLKKMQRFLTRNSEDTIIYEEV